MELLRHPLVGGVIFFDRNIGARAEFMALVAAVREVRPELLLAVDQEGGRVQRLRDGYTALPPMQCLGDAVARDGDRGAGCVTRPAGCWPAKCWPQVWTSVSPRCWIWTASTVR